MNELFGLLHDLGELAAEIGRVATGSTARAAWVIVRRLSIAARLAIAWPFVLLIAAMCGYEFAKWAVPIITIVALLGLLWMVTAPGPLGLLIVQAALPEKPAVSSAVAEFIKKVREAMRAIKIALGTEILMGIYFSYVPIANDRRLALIMVLIVAALVCFVGGKTKISKIVVGTLVIAGILITLMFYLRGRTGHGSENAYHPLVINFNIDRRVEANKGAGTSAPGTASSEQEQPLAPARPSAKEAQNAPPMTTEQTPPAKHLAALEDIKPISGDEGSLRVRMRGCWYAHVGEAVCEGYFENLDGSQTQTVSLDDSSGTDDAGVGFNAWLADGSIKFKGGGFRMELLPGMKAAFVFTIRNRSGMTAVGLNVKYDDSHAHWYESNFVNIPVALN